MNAHVPAAGRSLAVPVRKIDAVSAAVFDRRLQAASPAPIAAAFSGGGDSLMALLLTKAWAERHGRAVVALCVDHGLQAASADWTEAARRTADRLGVGFRPLVWSGPKPATGAPAAARAARHRLIADAARDLGARVIVFGHTADDVIEGELMRADGLRLGVLREWSPSPVWPEGRGLFLLRPLLDVRRAEIRRALTAAGERWIDDPANLDPRSPRARVRPKAAKFEPSPAAPIGDLALSDLAGSAAIGDDGAIVFERSRLQASPRAAVHRAVAAALTCAGGHAGPPRGRRLDALTGRLLGGDAFTATLGGAKIIAGDRILIVRDAGEARRGGLAPLVLEPHATGVWDGRFVATAGDRPVIVRALAGRAKTLPDKALREVRRLDAARRPALPLVECDLRALTCPILAETRHVEMKPLVPARFLAACGTILKEAAT
jgi:tRNA(Ile)-lysidine synthase